MLPFSGFRPCAQPMERRSTRSRAAVRRRSPAAQRKRLLVWRVAYRQCDREGPPLDAHLTFYTPEGLRCNCGFRPAIVSSGDPIVGSSDPTMAPASSECALPAPERDLPASRMRSGRRTVHPGDAVLNSGDPRWRPSTRSWTAALLVGLRGGLGALGALARMWGGRVGGAGVEQTLASGGPILGSGDTLVRPASPQLFSDESWAPLAPHCDMATPWWHPAAPF